MAAYSAGLTTSAVAEAANLFLSLFGFLPSMGLTVATMISGLWVSRFSQPLDLRYVGIRVFSAFTPLDLEKHTRRAHQLRFYSLRW